jgi:O-antigen/teichoic acid export membrane protein
MTALRLPVSLARLRRYQLWYAPLLALAMALMMLRLLAMARLLDVTAFAQFSGGILVSSTFGMLGCLGLQSMLQREWPAHIVRGQERRGLVRAAQCQSVALACACLAWAVAAAGYVPAGLSMGMMAVAILHGLAHQWFLVATIESRSRGEALRFARQNFVRALGALVLSTAAAAATGDALAALGVDALVTLGLAVAYFRGAVRRRGRIGIVATGRLAVRRLAVVRWPTALTLLAVTVIAFSSQNADRWVAAERLDAREFAHYAFAWIVLTMAQALQSLINAMAYPMIARGMVTAGREGAFRLCARVSLGTLTLGAALALPLLQALGVALDRFYPQYAEAKPLLAFLVGVALLRLSDFWSSFVVIAGFERRLLGWNLSAFALTAAVWSGLVGTQSSSASNLQQVALLAVLLTTFSYGIAALLAVRARQP